MLSKLQNDWGVLYLIRAALYGPNLWFCFSNCVLSERPYTSELVILYFIWAALYVRTCDFVFQIVFYPSGPIRPNLWFCSSSERPYTVRTCDFVVHPSGLIRSELVILFFIALQELGCRPTHKKLKTHQKSIKNTLSHTLLFTRKYEKQKSYFFTDPLEYAVLMRRL